MSDRDLARISELGLGGFPRQEEVERFVERLRAGERVDLHEPADSYASFRAPEVCPVSAKPSGVHAPVTPKEVGQTCRCHKTAEDRRDLGAPQP